MQFPVVYTFCSNYFVVCLQVQGKYYAIFQIFFSKKHNGLHINFPFFKHTEGLVCKPIFPKGKSKFNLNLIPHATIASHLVKYSHFPDGFAHFSQHGKVEPIVGRNAVKLLENNGHLFSVTVHGIADYEEIDLNCLKKKYLPICLRTGGTLKDTFKIAARIYNRNKISDHVQIHGNDYLIGPNVGTIDPLDKSCWSPILANTIDSEVVIMLTYEILNDFSKSGKSVMIFTGGFDPSHILNDYSKTTENLMLVYPYRGSKELKQRIKCIDLTK